VKGTKLWQPTGSPIIQGQSRTHVPFRRDLLKALLAAGLVVAVYDWFVSDPYTPALSEIVEFGSSFVIGVLLGLLPGVIALGILRSYRVRRAWLYAGAAGGLSAVLYLLVRPIAFA